MSSCTRWPVILAPDAASGWPRAMAPPHILVVSGFKPSSFSTAKYWGANASFTYRTGVSNYVKIILITHLHTNMTQNIPTKMQKSRLKQSSIMKVSLQRRLKLEQISDSCTISFWETV